MSFTIVRDRSGKIDESKITIEDYSALLVFGKDGNLPQNAIKGPEAVWTVLKSLQ